MSKIPSRDECKKFFDSVDRNGDGIIQPKELVAAMAHKGFSDREVLSWFANIDKDGDKMITYEEFINDVCKKPRSQTMGEIFDKADRDHSGKLSREELESACQAAGLTDKNSFQKSFEKADKDGSGYIDRCEFIEYMNTTY